MIGDFDTILNLVGTLNDTPGDDTPRERFRKYLGTGLTELGSIRDAVHTCTTKSGPQYAKALQDLVNYLGTIIGFDVEYGRYQGVVNQVGHDGLWRSGSNVVVLEVKTTDAYTINTATLLNYINSLRSDGRIKPDDAVIGLYVYAKSDPAVKQLEHAIIAEKRTQELRVGSVDAVLSLAELIREDTISHDEALAILWPSGVWIDDTVGLLGRIAAGTAPGADAVPPAVPAVVASPPTAPALPGPSAKAYAGVATSPPVGGTVSQFYLAPVADIPEESARETLERLLPAKVWAVSHGTPHRAKLKPGDRIAFYQASVGVVATATVATAPEDKPVPMVKDQDKYRWTFTLTDVVMFLDQPIVIDAAMRASLDAFAGRDPAKVWSWFVFAFRLITERDYALLTGTAK
jgi:hypothetical protein